MKFLNIKGNDIYIYGEIAEFKFWEEDVTAKEVAAQLGAMNGNIKIHINSLGGDVFSAIAIGNLLKNYDTTCIIEGVCASAATLISSSCKSVQICRNALMMIHDPVVGLCDMFNSEQLSKIQGSLDKVKSSIISIYQNRTGKSTDEISQLMSAETWYNADESVSNGLADEIVGEVDVDLDDDVLVANKFKFNCSKYDNAQIERLIKMDIKAQIRNEEIARVKDLMEKRGTNEYVNALIDTAISRGDKYDVIAEYVQSVEKVVNRGGAFSNMVADQLTSGAENVIGNSSDDEMKARAQAIANFANRL